MAVDFDLRRPLGSQGAASVPVELPTGNCALSDMLWTRELAGQLIAIQPKCVCQEKHELREEGVRTLCSCV